MLIDWNYTRPGDGTTPVGWTEANPNESMLYMLAMGPVANTHNIEIHFWYLRTERSNPDGSVGVTRQLVTVAPTREIGRIEIV